MLELAPRWLDTPGGDVDLRGKVALVTGASRGIGRATSEHLAAIGMKVVLAARSASDLAAVVAGITAAGGTAACIRLDATRAEDVDRAFAFAEATYGPVYFVFANAGVGPTTSREGFTLEYINRVMDVNQKAPMLAFQAALPHFKRNGGGVWVVNSSIASSLPYALQRTTSTFASFPSGYTLYSNSKAAANAMARFFGSAFARGNVRAYSICPACFTTDMSIAASEGVGMGRNPDAIAGLNPVFPGRSGDVANIAVLAAALAANRTLYPSGSSICVDNDVTYNLEQHHSSRTAAAAGGGGGGGGGTEVGGGGNPLALLQINVDLSQCKDITGRHALTAEKIDSIRRLRRSHAAKL